MYRGAEVVDEARQRDLCRPHAPSDGASALEHGHPPTVAGKLNRRCEPVRARADYDGIICPGFAHAPILVPRPSSGGDSVRRSGGPGWLSVRRPVTTPAERGRNRVEGRSYASVVPDVTIMSPLELGIDAHEVHLDRLVDAEMGGKILQ